MSRRYTQKNIVNQETCQQNKEIHGRISKNLGIEGDAVEYCKEKILKKESSVERKGKNYYITIDDCIITVNASSYTIITAHKI